MEKLLHVEQQLPWNKLPASFWDDYLSCAHLSNMPAHALQAADRANQLDPQNSNNRAFLVDASHKRFKAPDATAVYEAKEAWHATHIGSDIRFTSPMFGMEFSMPGEWKLSVSGIENGVANVVIKAGPYPGRSGPVIPNVSIMARPAKPGETLADFLKTAFPNPSARPTTVPVCPARACLAIERVEPNEYKGEGDGHLTIVVFQRDEPEYPGLIFEEPIDLPKTEGSGAHYFHADERLHRLPGTLYYLVAVDTADSVLTQARDVYSSFLKSMRVE
jgi:hypothetical protein